MPLSKADLDYKAAIEALEGKSTVASTLFQNPQLTKKVLTAIKRNAFHISGINKLSSLNYTKNSLKQALDRGESFTTWHKRVLADTKFGTQLRSLSKARLELVYRQNLGQAASDGTFIAAEELDMLLKYSAVGDSRTRPSHNELNGITLPTNDSFWNNHRPQIDFGCRCDLIAVSKVIGKKTDKRTVSKKVKSFKKKGAALKGFARNTTQDQKEIAKYMKKRAKQVGVGSDTMDRLNESNKNKVDVQVLKILKSLKGT